MFGIERKIARREKHLNGKLNLNLLFQQHPTSLMKVSLSVNIYFRLLHKFIYASRSFSLTRVSRRKKIRQNIPCRNMEIHVIRAEMIS